MDTSVWVTAPGDSVVVQFEKDFMTNLSKEEMAAQILAIVQAKFERPSLEDIEDIWERAKQCLAEAGDAWLYATPILHASDAAVEPKHRRVLQVDYAVGQLPSGLQWLGI
jgi:hypothetical protein